MTTAPPPTTTGEELTGVVRREFYRNGNFAIAALTCENVIKGHWSAGELKPGLEYRFGGRWEDGPRGPAFAVSTFTEVEPATAAGVAAYLKEHAPGFGEVRARQLYAMYGERAVAVLRENPQEVAKRIAGITPAMAESAAACLEKIKHFEASRIELVELFARMGFRKELPERCIRAWGVDAAKVVRRDPFKLLVKGFPGCGFLLVDALYQRLGLPLGKVKRQVHAIVHAMRADMTGHVWFSRDFLRTALESLVSNPRLDRAIAAAVRCEMVVEREGEGDGELWYASSVDAQHEAVIVDRLGVLMGSTAEASNVTASNGTVATVELDDFECPF